MSKVGLIKIYYSARVKRLIQALNKDIKSYRQTQQNPLKPLNIIVPNGHIQKYLNSQLTEINGIVANMEFPFLEKGLFDAVTDLQSNENQPPLLSLQAIELMILGFLNNQENQENITLAPLYNYLGTQQNPKLMAQKRWQLSQQLALLFIDYELSRPEMIQSWLAEHLFYSKSHNQRLKDIEAAQKDVYNSLLAHSDSGATLTGLLKATKLNKSAQPQPIFLFVPSRLSPLHRQIILLLAQHCSVHIYHFNVCREFWLDLETDAERSWRQSIRELDLTVTDANGDVIKNDDEYDVTNQLQGERFFDLEAGLEAHENPLLKAWGKPGRETLRLLSDLENDAIHAGIAYQDYLLDEDLAHDSDVADNTLTAIQNSVLNRVPGDSTQSDLKESIKLASAPSIDVEVSQVYYSILYELKQNPNLQLTDIAVLVTDMSTYRYVIEQVFDRLNRHVLSPLRYSISDSNAGEESLYAHAVSQLLNIIETDFIRDEVFTFLANPCVMTALDSQPGEVADWLQAAVDMGIYRGFNTLYESPDEDTKSRFTWRQGLQRLHRSLVQSTAEKSPLKSREIGRLSVLMHQLNHHKLNFSQSSQSCQQWQQTLQQVFDDFIAVPEDHSQEEIVALSVSQDLQFMAENQPELMLTFDDVKQFLLSRLAEMSAGRGRYLSGGVVCAALQPMRPVPFKLTYVLGLGESQFPGQIRHNTLDLAGYSRRIGDINQVENNKYLFLETLMSTREKLFISYVGRDEKSGEALSPSVVIDDLEDWFKHHSDKPLTSIKLPLSPTDNYTHPLRQNHASLLQNYSLHDYLLYCRQISGKETSYQIEIADISDQQKAVIEQFKTLYEQDKQGLKNGHIDLQPVVELSIRQLSDYMVNPTESIFIHQGGRLARIEDTDLLSDEPLTIQPLDKYSIMNRAVEIDLNLDRESTQHKETDLATSLDREYSHYLQQSRVPIELFASIEALKGIEDYKEYQALKRQIKSKELIPLPGDLMIGQVFSQQSVSEQRPAVMLTGQNDEIIHLSDSISHLLHNSNEDLAAQVIIRAGKHSKTKEYELLSQSFLEWCLMVVHKDVSLAEDFKVWLIFQDKIQTVNMARYLVDKKLIKDYLRRLSHDFIQADNAYLPLNLYKDLSFKYTKKDPDQPNKVLPFESQIYFAYKDLPQHLLDQLKDNYHQAIESAGEIDKTFDKKYAPRYDEIKYILTYQPAKNVLESYQSRFMLFFALLEQVDIREAP